MNVRSEVAAYTAADRRGVEDLLRKYAILPAYVQKGITSEQMDALFISRALRTLSHAPSRGWIARDDRRITGLVTLTPLSWDSAQLGMSAARLDYLVTAEPHGVVQPIKAGLLDAAMESAGSQNMRHITARVDARDLPTVHILEEHGFITVDGLLTFARTISAAGGHRPPLQKDDELQVRLATPADAMQAAELARSAFVYDRFHADPAIPPAVADQLHADWIRNSCEGSAADAVILVFHRDQLAGFVTCKLQGDTQEHLGKLVGTIVLVATSASHRGMGVAHKATLASLDWFHHAGAEIVEVGTQIRNIPAARLYQHCGFEIIAASCSLRKID